MHYSSQPNRLIGIANAFKQLKTKAVCVEMFIIQTLIKYYCIENGATDLTTLLFLYFFV